MTIIDEKKKSYAKATVANKIKWLIMPVCIGVAVVFFLATFVVFMVISSTVSGSVADKGDDLKRVQIENVEMQARSRFNTSVDRLVNEVKSSAQQATAGGIVVSLIVSAGVAIFAMMFMMKVLHKHICKPMIEMMFNIRKANDGLEELGIKMVSGTEDEIVLIGSVYFKIVQRLKEYADDVAKLSGLTEKFENSAHFDVLTGIYNRRRFLELVDKHAIMAAKKNEPTFVFMLDLDHFKNVNDTYGHDAGDEVLRVISGRIKDTVRPYDLFGRFGGEEFIMFIAVSDDNGAMTFAERIREIVLAAPVHFEGTDIAVTVSIGVAQSVPGLSFEKTVKLADKALYAAKNNGRNRAELYVEE
ncbi:MAG: GGDEF domain-containing protein [Oscillospiraceae bacterium]|nr:GGDEF domain-containing protein [Oscillospiraceae bacterium]